MTVSPDLRTRLHPDLLLPTPVLAASGGRGFGDETLDLTDTSGLGALVTPTITLAARKGSGMPRTAETSAGLLHSLGWPNPGIQFFVEQKMPRLRELGVPIIVSIHGADPGEWRVLAEALNDSGADGLELNVSATSRDGEAETLRRIERSVDSVRRASFLPIIAKLPAANVEIGDAAQTAEGAGADIIAVSQGFPGVAVRMTSRTFRLPGISGDLSGPCIKPLALYQVWRCAQSVRCPIIGSGGIMTGEDALEFMVAGASAVGIGIASSIHPTAIADIASEISAYLTTSGLASPSELVGCALRGG